MPIRPTVGNILKRTASLIDSRRFLFVILVLFLLQSLWLAVSFKYPMIYDEARHVPIIEIYASGFSPFSSNQPAQYDQYGSLNLATSGYTASFFHYIMALPFSLMDVFTDHFEYKVIGLRVLNVFMAASGVYLFARFFSMLGIRRIYSNIALLLFILLPIVPFISAHVNYDNALLPLTALFLIVATRILQDKETLWTNLGWLLAIGFTASLIKYTFMPIFLGSVIFIIMWLLRRHGLRGALLYLKPTAWKARSSTVAIWLACVIISGSLFSFIYIGNVIRYGGPKPECEKIMTVERCLRSPIAKRNLIAKQTSNTRPLEDFSTYFSLWYGNMIEFTGLTGRVADNLEPVLVKSLPVMKNLLFFGVILSVGLILYAWRGLNVSIGTKHALFVGAILLLFVFIDNYSVYRSFHTIYGTQPRYLLPVVPMILVLSVASVAFVLRRVSSGLKIGLFVVFLGLMVQGGGVITHILRSDSSWDWNNQMVITANDTARRVLAPFVNE